MSKAERPRTRLLGVDYGTVRVGLAITDSERIIASPLATLERRGPDADARFFRDLVEREEVGKLVVGLPVHTSGREGRSAVEAREFGAWLAEVTKLPAVYWDERFTTREAERLLWGAGLTHQRRRDRRDRVAAQLLLQGYLEAGCPEYQPPTPLEGPAEPDAGQSGRGATDLGNPKRER